MAQNKITIFIRLLDEGIDVWRPATCSETTEDGVYIIDPLSKYDAEDEKWEFEPGSKVRCEMRVLDGTKKLVAVARA